MRPIPVCARFRTLAQPIGRISLRGSFHNVQLQPIIRPIQVRFRWSVANWFSRPIPVDPKYAYPQNLLIYSAGTMRTFAVAAIKVSIMISFVANVVTFVVPQFLDLSKLDFLEILRVTTMSSIPPILAHLFTYPYVATVFLSIPTSARVSKKALDLYMRKIDPASKITFQMIKPWGVPHNVTVHLRDLRTVNKGFLRLENYATVQGQHKLIGFGQKFHVGPADGEKRARVPGLWSKISREIEQYTKQANIKGAKTSG